MQIENSRENGSEEWGLGNCGVDVAAKGTIWLAEFHRDRPLYRIKIRATEKIL